MPRIPDPGTAARRTIVWSAEADKNSGPDWLVRGDDDGPPAVVWGSGRRSFTQSAWSLNWATGLLSTCVLVLRRILLESVAQGRPGHSNTDPSLPAVKNDDDDEEEEEEEEGGEDEEDVNVDVDDGREIGVTHETLKVCSPQVEEAGDDEDAPPLLLQELLRLVPSTGVTLVAPSLRLLRSVNVILRWRPIQIR